MSSKEHDPKTEDRQRSDQRGQDPRHQSRNEAQPTEAAAGGPTLITTPAAEEGAGGPNALGVDATPHDSGESSDNASQQTEDSKGYSDISSFNFAPGEEANVTHRPGRMSEEHIRAMVQAEMKAVTAGIQRALTESMTAMFEKLAQVHLAEPTGVATVTTGVATGDAQEIPTKEDEPPTEQETKPESTHEVPLILTQRPGSKSKLKPGIQSEPYMPS